LLLSHAFNSLTQRLWLELEAEGHEISLEYDINDATTRAAVALFRPDVILAPFLKRAVPADVWRNTKTLIVHPGPLGDRGPSALDHAVQAGRETWGVTVLEARAEMDAGPVWAQQPFAMRTAPKSSLYRREVTEAAVTAVRMALARIEQGLWPLIPVNMGAEDEKPAMTQAMRAVDWTRWTAPKCSPASAPPTGSRGCGIRSWGTRSGCTTRIRAGPGRAARRYHSARPTRRSCAGPGTARSGSGISASACRRAAA
jgi:putative two-component system hydrogenase maturation factor HypX/HoxX